ncbi:MAG TPA: ABC-2 transporter permease [Virgibacillus sp.]|nr:ABC-2 transporter permease [Virgibacillus sp.]
MSGLVLNNLLSIRRSVFVSVLLTIGVVVVLLFTKETFALRGALFVPFLIIPVQAFEVVKQDAMSGWNMFEITLPVKRSQIVGSKYITFLLLFLASLIVTAGSFLITHILFYTVIDPLFYNFLLRGMGIILCVAAMTFPFTYKLGTEKSDTVMMISVGYTCTIFFGLSLIIQPIVGNIARIDEVFSTVFLIIAMVSFVASYIASLIIYKRKEF